MLIATFNSYGDRQISTPYKTNTPELIDKKFGTVDYVREGTQYTKFDANPPTGGFWANGWNITIIIFYLYLFFSSTRTGQTRGWIFTCDSSKDVKSRNFWCAFGSLNDVPLNFGVKLPKNWNFGGVNRVKPERQKFQTLITWKLLIRSWRIFYREYAPRVCLRGWSHGSPNKSKMAAGAIFNFGKMSILPHWIKISAPNFMGRCITAMRRWPRDQKSKPEVNSRDVIKWTS